MPDHLLAADARKSRIQKAEQLLREAGLVETADGWVAGERAFLTPHEVADWLRVPYGTLAMWRHHGRGPQWQKHGRRVVYARADVQAYIDQARADAAR